MLRARAAAANGPGSGLPLVDQQVDEAVYQAAFGGGAALQLAQNVAVQVVLLVRARAQQELVGRHAQRTAQLDDRFEAGDRTAVLDVRDVVVGDVRALRELFLRQALAAAQLGDPPAVQAVIHIHLFPLPSLRAPCTDAPIIKG